MVELFAFRDFLGYPVLIGTGPVRRRTKAPHAGQVERATSLRTLGHEPPGRDSDTTLR